MVQHVKDLAEAQIQSMALLGGAGSQMDWESGSETQTIAFGVDKQ